ncbi:hypothetical protein GCM10009678_35840 [Actinomadura kijaniata]|uniref:Uncharacterized protein n=1 Tax=Actinomadura namibiensis TaxID=182080 RepID=A0A7W3LQ57_ACTNM|nr:hypothetical protein [Actinomadura namibiensis]MBA8952239.1 hypothetical protein [Actinomadura namibiensis]
MVVYAGLIEIRYAGGQRDERDDARAALADALSRRRVTDSPDVAEGPGNTVLVRAVLEGASPLAALTALDGALGDALLDTGLFEEFDVSRRVLHAAPLDVAEQAAAWSGDRYRWRDAPPDRRRARLRRRR